MTVGPNTVTVGPNTVTVGPNTATVGPNTEEFAADGATERLNISADSSGKE